MEKMNLNSQFYFLKNAMKILLPVSLFSLVFSQYSSLLPLLLDSFLEFSSSCSIQLFRYSTERNYIFLLCNGILVVILKNSGLISKPAAMNINSEYSKESHKEKSREFQNPTTASVTTKIEVVEKAVDEKQGEEKELEQGKMKQDNLVTVEIADDNENEAYQDNDGVEIFEDEDEDEELEDEETLEELHKKCEDFIKRIKKEINMKK